MTIRLADLTIAAFLDPATGRRVARGEGDYAAIATVGRDPAGFFYVLDAWLRRAPPSEQIRALFDLNERWNYCLVGIETNCFQELLLTPIEEERQRRRAAGSRRWQMPVRPVRQAGNKQDRISKLEPMVESGQLRFAADLPEEFWRQLEAFPRARHDDGLDAVEGAVTLLRSFELAAPLPKAPPRRTPRPMQNF